jgi:hypothetical protein
MSKSRQEIIDSLLHVVRNTFSDDDLLDALSEPGAVDDVPEGTLRTMTETFQRMPDGQRLLLGTLRRLGEVQGAKGLTQPLEGPRAGLAEALRREVEAYCTDRAVTAATLAPEVLVHLTDEQLVSFTAQVARLRLSAREQLLALLETDDRVEASEAEFERIKVAMAERREALASKLQDLRTLIDTQRRRAREQTETRRNSREPGRRSTPEILAARHQELKNQYDQALRGAIDQIETK